MGQTFQDCIDMLNKPRPEPRTGFLGWLQRKWAMIQLRRDFAKRGVHVWKYTDEELKRQISEGLRGCVAEIERRELEHLHRL